MTHHLPAPIRTLDSRVVYENAWMSVREDRIERSDGSPGIFGVVDKPDSAVIIPWDGAGFHLVEQFRYAVGARYPEFPQGTWGRESADPEALARGELAEETGLSAGTLEHLGYLHHAYGYSSQGCHVWLATDLSPGDHAPDPEELDLRPTYADTGIFRAMIADGTITDMVTLSAYALWREHTGR